MPTTRPDNVHDLPEFRDREQVFADRTEAGETLAGMLSAPGGGTIHILAIPAGGVPVGAAVARELGAALDLAVVSKVTLPWNKEAGYGAVAFDGTVRLNESLLRRAGLSDEQVQRGIEHTREKVARRMERFRGHAEMPDLAGRTAVVIDDGLASGFTARTAIEAVGHLHPERLVVAVPTAQSLVVRKIAATVDAVYCANIRSTQRFAVAGAYRRWRDIDEDEVDDWLRPH